MLVIDKIIILHLIQIISSNTKDSEIKIILHYKKAFTYSVGLKTDDLKIQKAVGRYLEQKKTYEKLNFIN